ncbi:MAG TPA: hypothetical protein VGQ57_13915 [Polyangiaceae bacterium]|nr:hypothetical protein [Polyangiaceae bacterium]
MIERWVRFWDQREAPQSLALVRILVGSVLLGDLLWALVWQVVPLVWGPPPFAAGLGYEAVPPALVIRVFGPSLHAAWAAYGLAVVACVLFVGGVAYRVTSWLLVFAMVELWALQPIGDSIDSLLRIVLPVLAVSGAGSAWSFDAWLTRRRGRAVSETVPAWPRYLIVLQVLWLYISAGHQRDPRTWGPPRFSAIGNVLGDPHFARFTPGSLAVFYPLQRAGTLATMVFELSAPLYLLWLWFARNPQRGGRFGAWARRARLRWIWLIMGIFLHSGIALSMKIGLFPFGILALYAAFLHPGELAAGLAWLKSLAARFRTTLPGVAAP